MISPAVTPAPRDRGVYALAALVLLSTVVRVLLSRGVDSPWIAPDEDLYGLVGRSLVHGHGLTILGGRVPYYSLLYPAFVGVASLGTGVATGVTVTQVAQALLMSATAVPVFFWTRPLAGSRLALFAAALSVLIPGLAYSALLMSEALYYPVAVVAVWALAICLRQPTVRNQLVFLVTVGVALATRLQAVGIVGALVVALALLACAERSLAPFRRLLPTLAVFGAAGALWLALRIALGQGRTLGAYGTLTQAREYAVSDVLSSIAWQTGAVVLVTIGVPLIALGILAWETVRGREADAGVRALAATAFAYFAVTVVEVGVFASRFVEHITERQLLSVVPPAFVAFAVWLGRGLPRPQPLTSLLALAVAAPALLLPVERITSSAAAADALSTVPLEYLRRHVSQATFESLYAVVAAVVLVFAVVVPRRMAPVLAGVVAASLAAVSLVASHEMRTRSQFDRGNLTGGSPVRWLDEAQARRVALLVTGDELWPNVWHQMFWNRSITSVVRLQSAQSPGVVPQRVVTIRGDGVLVDRSGDVVTARQLAAPATVLTAGEPVASIAPTTEPGTTLWNVEPPIRVLQRVRGLQPNGDLYGDSKARIEVWDCSRGGRLELTLLGKQGLLTRIRANGRTLALNAIPAGKVWRPSVPAPPGANGGRCVYTLQTDGLIGSTRIEFVRPS